MPDNKNISQKPAHDFDKAEDDLLREGLKRSYTERFHMMTTLMKMDMMFRNATIKHKPFPDKKK